MPRLIPSKRRRIETIRNRVSIISSNKIKARAARIASRWTCDQRSDRKILSAVMREQLDQIINLSSNFQE